MVSSIGRYGTFREIREAERQREIERLHGRCKNADGGIIPWNDFGYGKRRRLIAMGTVILGILRKRVPRRGSDRPILLDHGCSGQSTDFFKIFSPNLCPRQSGDKQKQDKNGDPEARDSMKIPPESVRATVQSGVHDSTTSSLTTRPPQIQAGDDHDDCPGGSQVHKDRADIAHQQFSMKMKHHPGKPVFLWNGLQNV